MAVALSKRSRFSKFCHIKLSRKVVVRWWVKVLSHLNCVAAIGLFCKVFLFQKRHFQEVSEVKRTDT